jgi:hypothetical protein
MERGNPMNANIFTPSHTISNTFLSEEEDNPLKKFKDVLLSRILTAQRQAPIDTSNESLKNLGILDKVELKKQKDTNQANREEELQDAAIGSGLGIVAGSLANLLSGNTNAEGLMNNALPGISAVQTLLGVQGQEEQIDRKNYGEGVNKFYSTLFNINRSNEATKSKNLELDISTLKALKDSNDFSEADVFADENDLAYTKKTNKDTGEISIEPVMVNGTHIKLRRPPSMDSLDYRRTADIQGDIDKMEKEYRENNKLIGQLADKDKSAEALNAYIEMLAKSNPGMAALLAKATPESVIAQLENSQIDLEKKINELKPKIGQDQFEGHYTKKKSSKINLKSDKRELPKAK